MACAGRPPLRPRLAEATPRAGNRRTASSPPADLGFAQDALVFGATVLDVAPTVLTWFGLPFGDDMEGRVLLESFGKAPEVTRVPSWEPAGVFASDG